MKLTALIATLFVGVSLSAAAPESKWSFGLGASVGSPTSYTLRHIANDDVALGANGSVTYKTGRQAVRLRTDYIAWPLQSNTAVTTAPPFYQKARLWTGEADYLYFLTKRLYVQGGVGVGHWDNSYKGYNRTLFGTRNYLNPAEVNQPLVTAGFGYNLPLSGFGIKSTSAEVRYLSTQISGSAKTNMVQTGITLNF